MTPSRRTASSLPGTRPEGTQDEREAARRVQEMFSGIAPRYDFLNHLLSLSFDRLWRRWTARRFEEILSRPEARVLDLCCGTGDLLLAFERQAAASGDEKASQPARFVGADFAHPMLVRAGRKAAERRSRAVFVEADALALPFPDGSFDLVASAFGFRNLANYERGLAEMCRVLRPGGALAILEFSEPRMPFFVGIYRFYFEKILPRLGGAISGNRRTYAYLPSSVARFPFPEELSALVASARFTEVRFERWTGGIVALHSGRRA